MKLEKWKISTLHKMLSRIQEVQKDLEKFSDEEQETILKMHHEHHSLQHCLRWGEKALYEILEEVKP